MVQIRDAKPVTRTVTFEEVTVRVLCDCCGQSIDERNSLPRVTIEVAKRESYGGDGGETFAYDVCTDCWAQRVVPLFRTGPKTIEW